MGEFKMGQKHLQVFKGKNNHVYYTILVRSFVWWHNTIVPVNECFPFREAYPEASVVDVQFAYNISELVKLDNNR